MAENITYISTFSLALVNSGRRLRLRPRRTSKQRTEQDAELCGFTVTVEERQ